MEKRRTLQSAPSIFLTSASGARVSGAAEAFTAIEALVTGAIANRDVTAVRTGGGVLLEMFDRIAQRDLQRLMPAVGVSVVSIGRAGFDLKGDVLIHLRQLRH